MKGLTDNKQPFLPLSMSVMSWIVFVWQRQYPHLPIWTRIQRPKDASIFIPQVDWACRALNSFQGIQDNHLHYCLITCALYFVHKRHCLGSAFVFETSTRGILFRSTWHSSALFPMRYTFWGTRTPWERFFPQNTLAFILKCYEYVFIYFY